MIVLNKDNSAVLQPFSDSQGPFSVFLNGQTVFNPVSLHDGDIISLGAMKEAFLFRSVYLTRDPSIDQRLSQIYRGSAAGSVIMTFSSVLRFLEISRFALNTVRFGKLRNPHFRPVQPNSQFAMINRQEWLMDSMVSNSSDLVLTQLVRDYDWLKAELDSTGSYLQHRSFNSTGQSQSFDQQYTSQTSVSRMITPRYIGEQNSRTSPYSFGSSNLPHSRASLSSKHDARSKIKRLWEHVILMALQDINESNTTVLSLSIPFLFRIHVISTPKKSKFGALRSRFSADRSIDGYSVAESLTYSPSKTSECWIRVEDISSRAQLLCATTHENFSVNVLPRMRIFYAKEIRKIKKADSPNPTQIKSLVQDFFSCFPGIELHRTPIFESLSITVDVSRNELHSNPIQTKTQSMTNILSPSLIMEQALEDPAIITSFLGLTTSRMPFGSLRNPGAVKFPACASSYLSIRPLSEKITGEKHSGIAMLKKVAHPVKKDSFLNKLFCRVFDRTLECGDVGPHQTSIEDEELFAEAALEFVYDKQVVRNFLFFLSWGI